MEYSPADTNSEAPFIEVPRAVIGQVPLRILSYWGNTIFRRLVDIELIMLLTCIVQILVRVPMLSTVLMTMSSVIMRVLLTCGCSAARNGVHKLYFLGGHGFRLTGE